MKLKNQLIPLYAVLFFPVSLFCLEIDNTHAVYISNQLMNKDQNKNYTYPEGTLVDEDIAINGEIEWSSDKNLIIQTRRNINLKSGGKIISKGHGSVILRAGIEPDYGDYEKQKTSEKYLSHVSFDEKHQVILSNDLAENFVEIYYNPISSTENNNHKYYNSYDFRQHIVPNKKLRSYMLVNDIYDLQAIAGYLNGAYALSQNIDASETKNWTDEDNQKRGFFPIKGVNNKAPFSGTFNGNGYQIEGIFINRPNDVNVGIFGDVSGLNFYKAKIYDVLVKKADITGSKCVGGLIGQATGLKLFRVEVTNSKIKQTNDSNGQTSADIAGCVFNNTHEDLSVDQGKTAIASCEECNEE